MLENGYFVPPKTEPHSNETTHHQRAHIKLNRIDVFQQESEFKELGVEISFDDKAYLRPGTDVGLILREIGLEYISISETKLDASFPNAQFKVDGYHFPPFRKDRNGHGGGLIVFVKNDIIASRFTEYEPQEIECICTKLTIAKKHWLFSQYTDLQKQETLITFYLYCINL